MISAWHVDSAMLFCLREPHVSAADCQRTIQPEVELAVSQDASGEEEQLHGDHVMLDAAHLPPPSPPCHGSKMYV